MRLHCLYKHTLSVRSNQYSKLINICSELIYILCSNLFSRLRHHCCWASIVDNKKNLICVNVDDFKTVIVTLIHQKIEFADFYKISWEMILTLAEVYSLNIFNE